MTASYKPGYSCGVLNCGGGKCIHELLAETCPYCGKFLVLVRTNGVKFCSNHPAICEFEIIPAGLIDPEKPGQAPA